MKREHILKNVVMNRILDIRIESGRPLLKDILNFYRNSKSASPEFIRTKLR